MCFFSVFSFLCFLSLSFFSDFLYVMLVLTMVLHTKMAICFAGSRGVSFVCIVGCPVSCLLSKPRILRRYNICLTFFGDCGVWNMVSFGYVLFLDLFYILFSTVFTLVLEQSFFLISGGMCVGCVFICVHVCCIQICVLALRATVFVSSGFRSSTHDIYVLLVDLDVL